MMQNGYKEVPQWWYGLVLLSSIVIGLATLYGIQSTLPWWGFLIANLFAAIFILFFGAQMGITGFQFNQQPSESVTTRHVLVLYTDRFLLSCKCLLGICIQVSH